MFFYNINIHCATFINYKPLCTFFNFPSLKTFMCPYVTHSRHGVIPALCRKIHYYLFTKCSFSTPSENINVKGRAFFLFSKRNFLFEPYKFIECVDCIFSPCTLGSTEKNIFYFPYRNFQILTHLLPFVQCQL